jgi:DNA-directed RNA polymerase subunit RPC12/RpoP
MPKAGETPGKGTYVCLECGFEQNVHTDNEPLVDCPRCGGIDFKEKEKAGKEK